jgi:hypothetical protein
MNHYIRLGIVIIILLLLESNTLSTTTFCSAICNLNSCSSPSPYDCNSCQSPYALSSGLCTVSGQATIFTQELLMYNSFTAVGYQSNTTLSVYQCTGLFNYYMLGALGGYSSVQKIFTGLGVNHYRLSVLYGYALMGVTTWSQQLLLQLIDGGGTITNDAEIPSCVPDGLTGCIWSAGCYSNYANLNLAYSTDNLTLNFSLSTGLSSGQAWGIRDIVIILSTCDASCGSCVGATALDCISCASGLYFSGSICISSCPYYTLPDSDICVFSCPTYYFLNMINNYCEACPKGCQVCTSSDKCISWDGNSNQANSFYDLMAVWIIIIVIGLLILGIAIWRFCFAKKSFFNAM